MYQTEVELTVHSTVWKKIIFRYLEDYYFATMTDIRKISFDYCLDMNVDTLKRFVD